MSKSSLPDPVSAVKVSDDKLADIFARAAHPPEDLAGDPFASSPLELAALALAKRGLHVFPCGHDKKPLLKKWPEVATTDADQLRRWWGKWSEANIGVACGPSGLVVVDLDVFDPPKRMADGFAEWQALKDELGFDEPLTVTVRTPSGGLHYWFCLPKGVKIGCPTKKTPPGVDVKGIGGYAIAPPSQITAGSYSWLAGLSLDDVEIADLPEALVELLKKPEPRPVTPTTSRPRTDEVTPWAQKAFDEEIADLARATEGTRNDTLNRAALALGQIVAGHGLDEAAVKDALREAALGTGLELPEIEATIRSGMVKGAQEPRTVPEPKTKTAPGAPPKPSDAERPPDEEGEDEDRVTFPDAIPAGVLLTKTFPELRWAVPDLLPEGLTLLLGRPKIGKSYMALQLAQAVATGGHFLGKTPRQGRVLLVCLEDSQRRIQTRMREQGWTPQEIETAGFFFPETWMERGAAATQRLAETLRNGDYTLAVVDTLGVFLGVKDINDYASCTTELHTLQTVALQIRTAVVGLHHMGKTRTGDPVDDALGSTAIAAVADGVMGLYRSRADDPVWTIHIRGRDVTDQEFAVTRDEPTRTWHAATVEDQLKPDTLQAEVFEVLAEADEPMTAAQILAALKLRGREPKRPKVVEALAALVAMKAVERVPTTRGIGVEQPYKVRRSSE